jgi:hypothetical protein
MSRLSVQGREILVCSGSAKKRRVTTARRPGKTLEEMGRRTAIVAVLRCEVVGQLGSATC